MRVNQRLSALVVASTVLTGVSPAPSRASTFNIAKESLRAHIVITSRVPMVNALTHALGSNPAIRVTLRGRFPTVEVIATPAYGFASKVGRTVFVTLATSYRATGDIETAHPVYQGMLIEPDPRSPVGHADVELPVGEHAALALRITVRKPGYAEVSLRHPNDPAKDLLIGTDIR